MVSKNTVPKTFIHEAVLRLLNIYYGISSKSDIVSCRASYYCVFCGSLLSLNVDVFTDVDVDFYLYKKPVTFVRVKVSSNSKQNSSDDYYYDWFLINPDGCFSQVSYSLVEKSSLYK